jgi:HEAT repeat protein
VTRFWDTVKGFVTHSDVVIGLPHLLDLAKDPSGYKRENAVRRLGMLGDPAALDSLLRRANDWVPQVRLAALHAIRQLMIPANANAFVSSLPEIFHLEQCGRASTEH